MQFKNINAFTINLITVIRKKVVGKVDVDVFTAVKINQAHSLLFPHLAALKIHSFFIKNVTFKDTKHIKCEHEF